MMRALWVERGREPWQVALNVHMHMQAQCIPGHVILIVTNPVC